MVSVFQQVRFQVVNRKKNSSLVEGTPESFHRFVTPSLLAPLVKLADTPDLSSGIILGVQVRLLYGAREKLFMVFLLCSRINPSNRVKKRGCVVIASWRH